MERTKKLISLAGTLLMLASFVFIGVQISQYNIDFSVLASPYVAASLLILALIVGSGYLFAAFVFQSLLEALSGLSLNRGLVVRIYCMSNLYKYIPGGIMYAIGRNRIAWETDNLRHSTVAFATILEGALYALAGLALIALFAFDHFLFYIRQLSLSSLVWIGALIVAALCLLLAYALRQPISRFLKTGIDSGFRLRVIPKLLGGHILILAMQALTFPATLLLLGQSLTPSLTVATIGLFALSWLAGFLTPGAPSGLGIREAMMLMFLGGLVDESVLLTAIVLHRAMGVVGDVFVYGVGLVYSWQISRECVADGFRFG